MMYLSRLVLDPGARRVQRELSNPYELHRTLLRAFPAQLPPDERVLFRVEMTDQGKAPVILVQSQYPPDWQRLTTDEVGRYLLQPAETKTFTPHFSRGQRLLFRLRANPTIKREGRRHPLYREDAQRAWLARKARHGGVRVLEARIIREGDVRMLIPRQDRAGHMRATLFAVRFDGTLEVTEPEIFLETVRQGIGSGKGLGFGLLSLAPLTRG